MLSLLFAVATACGDDTVYRMSHVVQTRSEWEPVARAIVIPKIEFRDTPWIDILRGLEQFSLQHDPSKKGVHIYVPDRFKAAFAATAKTRFSIQLGPQISLASAYIEMPPPDWTYFPISAREVAVIPQSAVVMDLPK